ncbi:MAG: DUF2339 domain-containing protein [Proteobacteria bacterium]|nr:DUF2339 domain-containing protein [Pseudomonadota bacterium]
MNSVVAVIIGAVLGGAASEAFGAVVGALFGWLLVRTLRLERQVAALQRDLQAPARPMVETPPPATDDGPASMPAPEAAEVDAPSPPVEPTAAHARAPTRPPTDRLAPVRRWLFGGNTIVKAGIGILFVGLAFLAKYASEHARVPVELRLAGIGAVAIALLVVGWRLRIKRAGYAQVLQGGAVAVLYLTLFAAFKLYGVLGVGAAFAPMVAVAALSAALAVLQDARSLAVIGALGAFAAPLLVSTGGGSHIALFSYYLLIDLGIAAVAWHKTWRSLNLVGFVATFVIGTAWGVLQYSPDHYASSQGFLVAFFIVFVAIMLMPARRAESDTPWVNGSLLFGLPTVTFALQYGLVRDTRYGVALSALVLAAFYVGLAARLARHPRMALPFEGTLAVGTIFLTLVIPFALDARSTSGAWALEGAGLVWLGFRQQRRVSRGFGYALQAFAGIAMSIGHAWHGAPHGVWNAYLFSALMGAAGALTTAWLVQRHAAPALDAGSPSDKPANDGPTEAIAEPILIGWGMVWLLGIAGLQIDAFVEPAMQRSAWLASISAIAALAALLAARLGWRRIALPAIGHAPALALAALGCAALLASPWQDGGWWAWPIAFAVHAGLLARTAGNWPAAARTLVHALGALVVALLGALAGRALTAPWGDPSSAWPWLGWLAVPALLLWLLPRDAMASRWPLRLAPGAYRTIAAGVLTIVALAWTAIADIASDGTARPLPHVPLVNPLDLGIAFALVAAAAWLRGPHARALGLPAALRVALLGIVGFVWLNAMLVRAFHHYGGVPYLFEAWVQSLAVQTGLALLWTLVALALMWLAARRAAGLDVSPTGARATWMVGAVLLAVVVLKLLLVDFSGSGTLTRIVSFIGVGVLMLVIGYVAPLPSRAQGRSNANAG